MRMKLGGKLVLIALAVGAIGFGANYAMNKGYFNPKETIASIVPPKMDVPTYQGTPPAPPVMTPQRPVASGVPPRDSDDTRIPSQAPTAIPTFSAPTSGPAFAALPGGKTPIHVQMLAWNANAGLAYANGGVSTAPGSLMAKAGLNVTIERQDDYSQMVASMGQFAKALSEGQQDPKAGSTFVIIMGDALPNFGYGLDNALGKYGQAGEAVGMIGFSRGEDKCMLPPEVKADPQKARGSLIGGVLRDGDVHICFKWASDNGIPINPDEKTYDPNAMNFVAVDAFTEADEKLIAGYCEDRPIVHNGQRTGQTQHVCQNGTATWTPGDVKVAREKGGVVAVASTKEYSYQMPALIIGNKQWMAAHQKETENFLAAALQGGNIILKDENALHQAAAIEAAIYQEENADYWEKYFKGVIEKDKTGLEVSLGGSTVSNLADNAYYFGLNGADSIFKRVYTVYGGIDHSYYPADLPVVQPYDSVVNTSYLQALLDKTPVLAPVNKPVFSQTAPVKQVVAKKAWDIEFQTGKATFSPEADATLEDLLNQLAVSDLSVQIAGHTDNTGNSQINLRLSKERADAVKNWIIANAPSDFPPDRLRTRGFGDTEPVADNSTEAGRAKNRRVDITLIQTN